MLDPKTLFQPQQAPLDAADVLTLPPRDLLIEDWVMLDPLLRVNGYRVTTAADMERFGNFAPGEEEVRWSPSSIVGSPVASAFDGVSTHHGDYVTS